MTNPIESPAPAEAKPAKSTLWDDFSDMFFAPSSVFARRQDGKFGAPLFVLTLIIIVLFILFRNAMAPIYEAEFERGMAEMAAQNPEMSPEQLAMGRKFGDFAAIFGMAFAFPVTIIVLGALLWLAGKMFGSTMTARQGMLVSTFAHTPTIIGTIAGAVQAMLIGAEGLNSYADISLSPARFMADDTSPAMLGLVARFDLFGIWIIVLMGIGLAIVGRIERAKAMMAAGIVWVLGFLPVLIPALMKG